MYGIRSTAYKQVEAAGGGVVLGCGGGVVGCGTPGGQCQWSSWGVQVAVIEAERRMLPNMLGKQTNMMNKGSSAGGNI